MKRAKDRFLKKGMKTFIIHLLRFKTHRYGEGKLISRWNSNGKSNTYRSGNGGGVRMEYKYGHALTM